MAVIRVSVKTPNIKRTKKQKPGAKPKDGFVPLSCDTAVYKLLNPSVYRRES